MRKMKSMTKTKDKKELMTCHNALYRMAMDRLNHGSRSKVPISFKKLEEMLGTTTRAIDKA